MDPMGWPLGEFQQVTCWPRCHKFWLSPFTFCCFFSISICVIFTYKSLVRWLTVFFGVVNYTEKSHRLASFNAILPSACFGLIAIHLNSTYNYSSLQTMLLLSMKCETCWQMRCVSVISIQYNGSHELHQALSVHNHCGWGHRIFVFVLLILLAMAIACDVFTLYRRDDIVAYLSKLYTASVRLDTFHFQLSHIMKIKSKKTRRMELFFENHDIFVQPLWQPAIITKLCKLKHNVGKA